MVLMHGVSGGIVDLLLGNQIMFVYVTENRTATESHVTSCVRLRGSIA